MVPMTHFWESWLMDYDTICPDVMYMVFIRAALIIEFFRFQHMCLITYFHYGLNMYGFKSW